MFYNIKMDFLDILYCVRAHIRVVNKLCFRL